MTNRSSLTHLWSNRNKNKNKWALMSKNFFSKRPVNKIKRKCLRIGKQLQSRATDKVNLQIYKLLSYSSAIRKTAQSKKWAELIDISTKTYRWPVTSKMLNVTSIKKYKSNYNEVSTHTTRMAIIKKICTNKQCK